MYINLSSIVLSLHTDTIFLLTMYFVRIFKREEGSDRYEVGDSVQLNLDTNTM